MNTTNQTAAGIEAEMAAIEAAGDRAQTARENGAKAAFKASVVVSRCTRCGGTTFALTGGGVGCNGCPPPGLATLPATLAVATLAETQDPDGEGVDAAMKNGAAAKRFLLAGNARVTFVSEKTGARFTYRVRAKKTDDGKILHFVGVLTGSNNEDDYTFLGTIFEGKKFVHGKKSKIAPTAPSAKAFGWAWSHLATDALPPSCAVHHEGRCGRCGRGLTVPESIESGLGPVCAGKE